MWRVLENKKVKKQLAKCPKRILQEYEAWKVIVSLSGPSSLRKMSGYNDHGLKGEWKGVRTSYLNDQWRVFYHVDKKEITVSVLEVNPHDYRKKG